jgi:hypothetical protein
MVAAMSILEESKEVASSAEAVKSAQKKDHSNVVLIPQPSDDPEDPLVSTPSTKRPQDFI